MVSGTSLRKLTCGKTAAICIAASTALRDERCSRLMSAHEVSSARYEAMKTCDHTRCAQTQQRTPREGARRGQCTVSVRPWRGRRGPRSAAAARRGTRAAPPACPRPARAACTRAGYRRPRLRRTGCMGYQQCTESELRGVGSARCVALDPSQCSESEIAFEASVGPSLRLISEISRITCADTRRTHRVSSALRKRAVWRVHCVWPCASAQIRSGRGRTARPGRSSGSHADSPTGRAARGRRRT